MAKITELLLEMLRRQIADRGIVVWYDPPKSYAGLVQRLSLPGTTLLTLEDGFFRLREQLEPLLECVTDDGLLKPNAEQPPQVVVYVPASREESTYALIEAETAGVVIEPSAPTPERNTRLGALVEKGFREIAPAKANHLARQADDGLLTLEELDRLAEESASGATGALRVIFGPASVDEILVQFAASDERDQALVDRQALPELARLVQEEIGLEAGTTDSPLILRAAVRRHLLMSELVLQFPEEDRPQALARWHPPIGKMQGDMVIQLCRQWRNRLDLKEAYADAAEQAEKSVGLAGIDLPLQHLGTAETFPILERRWLEEAAVNLLAEKPSRVLEIVKERSSLFWPRERAELQMEWKVIDAAANVCAGAARVKDDLHRDNWSLEDMIKAYAVHSEPWMVLDRAARQMETRYARLDTLEIGAEGLEKVIALSRQRYAEAIHALSSTYSLAAAASEFSSRQFLPQTAAFRERVWPLLDRGMKTAYFLIDALRFEMAAEVLEGLGPDYDGRLEPVLGQLPGITSVGMAALLPGAEQGLVLEKETGGLVASVQDHSLKNRQQRLAWLAEKAGVPTVAFRLGEVVKLTARRRKEIDVAQLVVVTSQEVDRLGEEASDEDERRLFTEEVLERMRRAVRSLARVGVQQFVIAADHGFLTVEATDPGLAMDPPGGDTVELHPRVWIGRGGTSGDAYLRFKASDLELGGSLEFAFPRGLGTFRVRGGAGAYFHGGLSPQEHVLPLLLMRAAKAGGAASMSAIRAKLSMAKAKITNRLFTVVVEAFAEGLLPESEKRVRVDVLAGRTNAGSAVAAAYDFQEGTREINLILGKPNVVTLMITAADTPPVVTVQIVDCESQLVLAELKDVPVELGF